MRIVSELYFIESQMLYNSRRAVISRTKLMVMFYPRLTYTESAWVLARYVGWT